MFERRKRGGLSAAALVAQGRRGTRTCGRDDQRQRIARFDGKIVKLSWHRRSEMVARVRRMQTPSSSKKEGAQALGRRESRMQPRCANTNQNHGTQGGLCAHAATPHARVMGFRAPSCTTRDNAPHTDIRFNFQCFVSFTTTEIRNICHNIWLPNHQHHH